MKVLRSLWLGLVLLLGGLAGASLAQAQFAPVGQVLQVQTEQATARLLAYAPQGVPVGQGADSGHPAVWLGLEITHAPDWHTYWKNSGDSGMPTELHWTLPPGVLAGDIAWPVPKKIPIAHLTNYGYEDTVLLAVPLIITPDYRPGSLDDSLDIGLQATWLVCRQECIPQDGSFSMKLPLRSSTAMHREAFETAWEAQPADLPGGHRIALSDDAQRLQVQVHGLPAAAQGQALELFPETPDVLLASAQLADQRDTDHWVQRWDGPVWQADLPVSPERAESPERMPLVLVAANGQGWRIEADVTGTWPELPSMAAISPALEAALQANAAAQQLAQSSLPPPSTPSLNLWLALLGAFVGGMILNLMPCVFPVLAIKVLGFAQHGGDQRAHRANGLAYSAGVVLSFVALGGLMLALRAAGEQLGWGFQLQSPAVVAALALLFAVIGLNLAGVFEFGQFLPSRVATLEARHPTLNAGLSGVLAVAVASPCTAPFMGASLGLAIGLPALQALAVFAAIGAGMALPYLAASWLPAVARALPRPGAWMDVFKKFMSFPMFATTAWLLWVLGQQTGIDGAAALLALLLLAAFALWALGLTGRARWSMGAVAILLLALLLPAFGPVVLTPMADVVPGQAVAGQRWQPWSAEREQALLADGQPVFVDFTAAWCVTCQYNKKTTLADAQVLDAFDAAGVHTLRADWTRRDATISAELQKLGRSGVPVYALYAPGKTPVVLAEILTVAQVKQALADQGL